MAAPTTNMPANSTTVELDRPLNTCFVGIKPRTPHAIAPAVAVIARGIISVIKKMATTSNRIKHFTSLPILIFPPFCGNLATYLVRQDKQPHSAIQDLILHLKNTLFLVVPE